MGGLSRLRDTLEYVNMRHTNPATCSPTFFSLWKHLCLCLLCCSVLCVDDIWSADGGNGNVCLIHRQTRSQAISFCLSLTHTHKHTQTHRHTLSLSHAHTRKHTQTHRHTLSLSLTLTHANNNYSILFQTVPVLQVLQYVPVFSNMYSLWPLPEWSQTAHPGLTSCCAGNTHLTAHSSPRWPQLCLDTFWHSEAIFCETYKSWLFYHFSHQSHYQVHLR